MSTFTPSVPTTDGVAQVQIPQIQENFEALRNLERSSTIPANSTNGMLWRTATANNPTTYQDNAVYQYNAAGAWQLLWRDDKLPILPSSADEVGSIMQRTSTGWEQLKPTTAGMVLVSKGTGVNSTWADQTPSGFQFTTSTAASTFVTPAGVTDLWVTCVAGGGGGAGGRAGGLAGGGGGGAGQMLKVHLTGISTAITFKVGGSGSGGAAGGNGNAGGNSSFGASITSTAGSAGLLGAVATADFGAHTASVFATTVGGQGGYAGFSGDAGRQNSNAAGSAASGYGNGGGGGASSAGGGGGFTGGAGAKGCVLIEW